MFNEFFKTCNCDFRSNCENVNTYSCINCSRNQRYLVDNYKLKVTLYNSKSNPCDNCGCNPKNGGSGICNCTLNLPEIR